MHCGPPNRKFGWAMADPAHAAAPPMGLGPRKAIIQPCVHTTSWWLFLVVARQETADELALTRARNIIIIVIIIIIIITIISIISTITVGLLTEIQLCGARAC